MPLIVKEGVRLVVVPQIFEALQKIDAIFAKYGYPATITSANDGTHGTAGAVSGLPSSLHYIGAAIDLRTKGIDNNSKASIVATLKSVFPTPPWYVIFEHPNQDKEHIHIQHGLAIYDRLKQKIIGYSHLPNL